MRLRLAIHHFGRGAINRFVRPRFASRRNDKASMQKSKSPLLADTAREKWGTHRPEDHSVSTSSSNVPGTIVGQGCGFSAVAAGGGPNLAVTV